MRAVTLREIEKRCRLVLGQYDGRNPGRDNPEWCKAKVAGAVLQIVKKRGRK